MIKDKKAKCEYKICESREEETEGKKMKQIEAFGWAIPLIIVVSIIWALSGVCSDSTVFLDINYIVFCVLMSWAMIHFVIFFTFLYRRRVK